MRAPDVEARTPLRTVVALRERWHDSSITAGQRFSQLLGRLTLDQEVLTWVRDALRASHAEEKREHEAAIGRLRAEYGRLQSRMHAMYVDKLDGNVDGAFSIACPPNGAPSGIVACAKSSGIRRPIGPTLEEGVRLLELARNAQRLFEKQNPRWEKLRFGSP
jgi:site-specific DNA recombinase